MKNYISLLAPAVLAGCMGSVGGELVQPGVPVGNIVVKNGSSATITAVTVSQCSAGSHGFNRLPSGVSLSPGQSYSFTVSAGCYDVHAGYGGSWGYATAEFEDKQVPAGRTYTLTVK